MTISRRVYVKSGGIALFSVGLDPLFLARAALGLDRPPPPPTAVDRPILVCLFQRGAVDGLNMIVPHGDPIYYRERPRIAVPEKDVLDLDGYFGLHPRLAALQPLWDSKSLAVIHAVGSPDATRSHFDAQDYLESGTPGVKATPDGWLNRYCQHDREHQDTPFRAVAFGPELPRILAGTAPSLAIADLQAFGLRAPQAAARDRLTRAFEELYAGSATGLLSASSQEAFEAVQTLKRVGRTVRENGNSGTDHGHATAMLLLGGPVNGGRVLGAWPGLDPASRFEGRDVAVTTDFRDLFAEVLARHLGARDLSAIFPGFTPDPARFPGAISA